MKKFKAFVVLLVVVFVALVIYQNREYFFTKQALSLSLGVETWQWTAPEIENVYYFGGSLLIGLLITGYLGLCAKFRSRKTMKMLNVTINSQHQTIDTLQTELDKFKSDPYFKKKEEPVEELDENSENDAIELPANLEKSQG
ncbi:conserved hypothetical protein [Desulfamplus magnetovallimortis]|uniref:Lipopolysaccharide assembly protein A domain-containing protein n=1 Tax=Desulfamplus magnetovallimortis TaxID=1246637 RepID=A0A1W1HBZ9_9BACT|nr:hypothetical protein [Desulfamplus magnetovallimortis]SLM30014.1 conserved hypothetical protein [Desulfamplus magnetovallimortis]